MLDFPRCAPSSGGSHAAIAARECDDFASIHCAGPLPAEKSASLGERAQQVTASACEGRYRVLDLRKSSNATTFAGRSSEASADD